MAYIVSAEEMDGQWIAHVPDLPGCVATGKTREQATRNMYDAIEMHLQGLREDKLPIPK